LQKYAKPDVLIVTAVPTDTKRLHRCSSCSSCISCT